MNDNIERLLDNAACASQERRLLRTDEGRETALREAVRRNCIMPLIEVLQQAVDCQRGDEHPVPYWLPAARAIIGDSK